jgi:N-acetylglucosamine-6-sulfatase
MTQPALGRRSFIELASVSLLAASVSRLTVTEAVPSEREAPGRPNIVLIVTDDLDSLTLEQMPGIDRLLRQEGTTFANFMVSMPSCGPSRASILRGQYAHNHGMLDNTGTVGGFGRFFDLGREESTVATWLHDAGYRTGLFGKYLNDYDTIAPEHVPPGWDEWVAWAGRGKFLGYRLNEQGTLVDYRRRDGVYETDLLTEKARLFIEDAVAAEQPFFAYVAPHAPHEPNRPAPRHESAFLDATAPRSPSFNETDVADKPAWVQALPSLTDLEAARIDMLYQRRLQSMLAVDEMVATLIDTLTETGVLANTYILLTSDNGWHYGEHRLPEGKGTPYEETIRVPLIVRGPDVPAGRVEPRLASVIDLAPTFAALADTPTPDFIDGRSLTPLFAGDDATSWRQAVLVEMSSTSPSFDPPPMLPATEPLAPVPVEAFASPEAASPELALASAATPEPEPATHQDPESTPAPQPRSPAMPISSPHDGEPNQKGVIWGGTRIPEFWILRTADWVYIEYEADAGRELYELRSDPFQEENLITRIDAQTERVLSERLAALATCAGATCTAAEDAPVELSFRR